MIHDTQSAQILQKQDYGRNIYAIMKTMCSPGYHHNNFVATHALGHRTSCAQYTVYHVRKCMSCHKAIVVITAMGHCFHDCTYIGRDGGLSTRCHSCRFACQQRVLKTFPGPGYLHPEDGVVYLTYW